MPRMTSDEFEFWKKRLAWSHRVWSDKGFTGDEGRHAGGSGSRGGHDSFFRYIQAYRGKYPELEGWGGLDIQPVQVIFSAINTLRAQLSSRNPEVIVRPDREEFSRGARIMELIQQHFINELKMKRQWDKALRDSLLMPAGFVRHLYTPEMEVFTDDGERIELFAHAKPDLPSIRRWPLWDIRIDPKAEDWYSDGDAEWCAFRSLFSMDQIRKNPNMITREDLHPTIHLDERMKVWGLEGTDPGPEMNDLVEVWTVYDKTEKKWFQMTEGSGKTLREPDDWPIPWESLPYDVIFFNDDPADSGPRSMAEMLWPYQVERIKVRTLMSELVKRLRRVVFIFEQGLNEGEAKKLQRSEELMEFILTQSNPADIMKEIQIGGFPQELLIYDRQIAEDIRETIGQSLLDRAQRINVETATEAAGVRQGSAIQSSRNQERFENFLSDIMRNFGQALQHTIDEPLMIQIAGQADTRTTREFGDFLQVNPDDIKGEFKYTITVGSTLPRDNDAAIQKRLAYFQVTKDLSFIDQKENIRQMTEDFRYDSARLVLEDEQLRGTNEALAQQGAAGGANGPARGGGGGGGNIDPATLALASRGGGGGGR